MEQKKNKLYFSLFIFIILLFVVGGFFYTHYMINKPEEKPKSKKTNIVELKDSRVLKTKDYIYFENGEELDSDEEIFYEDIVLNIKNQKSLEETLNTEFKSYKSSIVKTDEEFYLPYRLYEVVEFDNYISLIIKDYGYNNEDHLPKGLKGYIFNKEDGTLISEDIILSNYNKTLNDLINPVREKISVNRLETDLLEETMSNLNYFIYINKIGNLEIAYTVKSTLIDYYDKITLD